MQKDMSPLFNDLLEIVNTQLTSGEDVDSKFVQKELMSRFPVDDVRSSWVATSVHDVAQALECEVVSLKRSSSTGEPYSSSFIPNPRESVKRKGLLIE